jgi:hypothetical protein
VVHVLLEKTVGGVAHWSSVVDHHERVDGFYVGIGAEARVGLAVSVKLVRKTLVRSLLGTSLDEEISKIEVDVGRQGGVGVRGETEVECVLTETMMRCRDVAR